MFSRNDFSIWSVLKNCIGKELSKITMPVIFKEPLSFLQRMVEYMEYAQLLRRAAEDEDPVYRMQVNAVTWRGSEEPVACRLRTQRADTLVPRQLVCVCGCGVISQKLVSFIHFIMRTSVPQCAIINVFYVRFEVFTAVTMKNGVYWDVTPCGSCKNRGFGGT
jgi:hypothetical protein